MLSNWRNLITGNWGLKLASLILAMIIWLALIGQEKNQGEKTIQARLEIHNRPEQLLLVETPPDYVNLTIRTSIRRLPEITDQNVHVALDLSSATLDQTQYALNHNMVSLPAGVEIRELSPSMVTLKLERRQEITIPVVADQFGTLPEGHKLISVECDPTEVRIYGPESKIKDNMQAKTSLIDLSKYTQSREMMMDLILPDPDLRLVESGTKVLVRLIIEKEETGEGTQPPGKKDGTPVKKK
jgi:YbbR domain-containing protein